MMDLDHFKGVNDRLGHSAGDQVLAAAVQCLMEHMRPYDSVFRYGGEEFLISAPNTDLSTGYTLAVKAAPAS
jgi:diguanylate cyclase